MKKWGNTQFGGMGFVRRCFVQLQELGGVTQTRWNLVHLTRDEELGGQANTLPIMAPTCRRTLQTALDDTESVGLGRSASRSRLGPGERQECGGVCDPEGGASSASSARV